MNKKPYLQLSVHELVDFLLRKGDIDNRIYNQETMQLGTKLHSSYQEAQGNTYLSEYDLSGEVETEEGVLFLQGRADGIILDGGTPIIDEVKTTVAPLEKFFEEQEEWHLGQALCYAYLYLQSQGGSECGVQLTYISQLDPKEKMRKAYHFSKEEIETRVKGYARDFLAYRKERLDHIAARDASVKGLKFPFSAFRPGQRSLSKYVYNLCQKGGALFVEAPTGIGKTISCLYPGVLNFKDGQMDRVFYLTAKNTGGTAAYDAMTALYEQGFVGRDSFLVAKEKICFQPGHACNPDDCPFAKGYYTKLKAAIQEAVEKTNRFDLQTVSVICFKHMICPFEFQLDLSLEADVIIGDYNYFFDPMVHLERYFDPQVDSKKYLVLVDEAHNLIDRGREMYSAALSSKDATLAKKSLKGPRWASLRKRLNKIIQTLEAIEIETDEPLDIQAVPLEFLKAVEGFRKAEQEARKNEKGQMPDDFRAFSREASRFGKIADEYYGSHYRGIITRKGENTEINLLCVDPSSYLKNSLDSVKGGVLFSATLSPIEFYMNAICGSSECPNLLLPSPFPKENLKILIAPKVSVRYKDREKSYAEVAQYLMNFVRGKMGNYFLYFPSYEYMENIRPFLDFSGCNILIQGRRMSVEDRELFLSAFLPNPTRTTIGLLILGGAFSEGIDLADDRLIGVGIVGVGIPQVNHENNLIRAYREEQGESGYDFAYKFPGINKVTQAVGRLIRSETDVGAALLIDDRYLHRDYRDQFARIWPDYEVVLKPEEVTDVLSSFYKKDKD